ncbi:DUF3365 domain-containing protein [Lutibacter sp.]|uniref:Tll0287-like domain-containing protein n=1 Tax=Lutibacter sp. TaxID=1925666 RepID=UPI00356833C7
MKNFFIFLIFTGFISCNHSLTPEEKQEYSDKGKEIVQASFNALSEKLTEQMKTGGAAKAIPFCNVEALPLTKQLSEKYNVTIKRTSDKLRNQKNKPSERESKIIDSYQKLISEHKEIAPIVEMDSNNNKHFYAPITVKANCLVCHGIVKEFVTVKTDSIIKSLYPNDKAVGYLEGELRGIWSIAFKK